jgi:hypothetical protein
VKTAMQWPTGRVELEDHLDRLDETGAGIPCRRAGRLIALWTSEDPGDQDRAAALCAPCAGRPACAAYITAHPTETGVYGALTDNARRGRPGRPRKETAA